MERIIITKVLLILFFSFSLLFSTSSIKEIDGLYKKIPYASKSETAHILHELENLYISAVVSDNKLGIAKTLKGIIKCQKLLGLNSKTYESELAELSKNSPKPKITPKPKQTQKPKKQPTVTQKNNILKISSIKQKNNTIIIKFNEPMHKSKMLFFEINQKGNYRDIYDFKANLNFKAPKLSLSTVKSAKIAQNRTGKVRLVLADKNKIYSNAYIRKGTLFIEVQKNPNTTRKPKIIAYKKPKISKEPTTKQAKGTLYASSKIIVIDPGHGGKDSGAVGYKKYQEKNAVLKISKTLQGLLKKKGYKVYLTRDRDKFIKLSKRTHFANKKGADLFISIHANASPSAQKLTLKGIETFFLSPAKTEKAKRIAAKENKSAVTNMNSMSKNTLLSFLNTTKIVQSNKLAIDLQKGMLTKVRKKHKDVRDGGVREAPFWVLVGAQMPAVLVEVGYITNPKEADRLFNPFYQKSLAEGMANGVNNYFINNQ
ncbi:MAG TPA: N-acetylmuramoyl-L-alanine amidase [Campylobacterales bacterium]|nr:N-acetylmuramoyl-L-alanine amidase [Campylobacterales bacterium]